MKEGILACLKLAFGDQNGRVDSKSDKDVGEGLGNEEENDLFGLGNEEGNDLFRRENLDEEVQESETSLTDCINSSSNNSGTSSVGYNTEGWYLAEPRWRPGMKTFPEVRLASIEQYERIALDMELTVQRLIQQHNYNTVGNFIRFYSDFRNTTVQTSKISLSDFYRCYVPQLLESEMTCVGLGLALLQRLNCEFGPSSGTYLVSSEEGVEDITPYKDTHPSHVDGTEKEHVMVCMKVCIEDVGKERRGVLLLDPGYHVARGITVMYDQKYPHTGWFTQSEEPWVKREFCYYFAPPNSDGGQSQYIVWETKETRNDGRIRHTNSLVYIGQPFVNPVEVTEKRNLVYEMRCWLSRNTKGEIIAGVHFPVRPLGNMLGDEDGPKFTLRHSEIRHKTRTTIPFSKVYLNKLSEEDCDQIERCNRQMGLCKGFLMKELNKLAQILADIDFVAQLLGINNEINCLAS